MKKRILVALAFVLSSLAGYGQTFNFGLGVPMSTAGWTLNSPTTYAITDTIVLQDSYPDTSGFVYYATPVNLTACAGFKVSFDFRIDSHATAGPGDGMAFWILDAAPTAATSNSAPQNMGVPVGANGVGLFIDTYDDDLSGDNPRVSLNNLNNTPGFDIYNEPTNAGQIAATGFLTTLTDGLWHTCVLTYDNGDYEVYIDGGAPAIVGSSALNITSGYFGFSSSTRTTVYSKHSVRNVEITGSDIAMAIVPPVSVGVILCQDSTPGAVGTPTAIGDSLIWYDAAGTQLPSAPQVPLLDTGCQTFFVSNYIAPCGESPLDTVNVCVKEKPLPPNITYNKTYCVGDPFFPFPGGVGLVWYTQPTGGVGDTAAPIISTAVPDTFLYYVSLLQNGCESNRTLIDVYVLETPTANFDSILVYGCIGDSVQFVNMSNTGDSAIWDFGDGSPRVYVSGPTDSNWNPTHIYYSQGLWDVKLIVMNKGTRCLDSITKKLNNLHPLIAGFRQNDDTVCQGEQVNFTDTSIYNRFGSFSFYWDFGDGDTSTLQDPPHIYANPGVYTVMHVVTDFVPCRDTVYHTIVVDSLGQMTFDLSDATLCEGDMVTLTGDFTDIGLNKFTWFFGDGFVSTNVNPVSHTYDSSATYNIRIIGDYRACPDDTVDKLIYVQPYPAIDLGPDSTMCPNGPGIVLGDYNNQFNPTAKWLWSTGDSTSAITVRHPGIYTAQVTADGCSASDSVEIFKDCYIDIPNSFTPNNDGSNDYFLPRQLLSKSVSKFNMQVFNRWGEVVFKTEKIDGRGWDGKFNGKDQPLGVYVYLIDVVLSSGAREHYQGNVTLIR